MPSILSRLVHDTRLFEPERPAAPPIEDGFAEPPPPERVRPGVHTVYSRREAPLPAVERTRGGGRVIRPSQGGRIEDAFPADFAGSYEGDSVTKIRGQRSFTNADLPDDGAAGGAIVDEPLDNYGPEARKAYVEIAEKQRLAADQAKAERRAAEAKLATFDPRAIEANRRELDHLKRRGGSSERFKILNETLGGYDKAEADAARLRDLERTLSRPGILAKAAADAAQAEADAAAKKDRAARRNTRADNRRANESLALAKRREDRLASGGGGGSEEDRILKEAKVVMVQGKPYRIEDGEYVEVTDPVVLDALRRRGGRARFERAVQNAGPGSTVVPGRASAKASASGVDVDALLAEGFTQEEIDAVLGGR